MKVTVTKSTSKELMNKACEKTFLGKSNISLLQIYKLEHSPARTQMFWVECEDIPLFVSTHLLRHHVGSQPFALTHRVDRRGKKENVSAFIDEIKKELDNLYKLEGEELRVKKDQINELLTNIESKSGRNNPTNLGLFLNAQSLIDMAKLRLCNHASKETREVFIAIKNEVAKVDPDLVKMMVRKCVYRNGICPESCGFNKTAQFKVELEEYLSNF